MGETRVNLKHLLEDLRDSYPYAQEEAIITELVANALDSGASRIHFLTNPDRRTLCVVDDGRGMTQKNLEDYHDIAATTKIRGKGIGFAGVGVKLALLVGEEVITETKNGSFHKATRWKLESSQRAPWEYVAPRGLVTSYNGTAVSITLRDERSDLLSPDFIKRVIQKHFSPILDEHFMDKILKYIYTRGVAFVVNQEKMEMPHTDRPIERAPFVVELGRREKPVGIGFLSKSRKELPEEQRGVAISTYGKVIKRGWDWLGVTPRNPMFLTGIVEIPYLSEILTTNKADFLKDVNSLQKYYRYRKAIQEAIEPILRQFGEIAAPRERPHRDLRPLEKEIEHVLGNMLEDFPELTPLLGRRRRTEEVRGIIPDPKAAPIGTIAEGVEVMTGTRGGRGQGSGVETMAGGLPGERIAPSEEPMEPGREYQGRRRRPGLMIGFEDNADRDDLGWMTENTVWINKGHPAYRRVIDSAAENYHIVLAVAWVLSRCLESGKSPQDFINRFLSGWGRRL